MTRALSLVTQGNPHHPPPSLTKAKRAASSPNPHPHLSHRNLQQPLQEPQPLTHPPPQPLQQPPQTCPPSPPVLPQQTHEHRHYHHPPQHPPQQDLLLGVGQGQGGSSSPRAPAEPHLLPGHASPGALPPRTAAACPASAQGLQSLQSTSFRGPASPEPINPQQELQQLLQLQQERQQGMLAAHAHPPPPQPPPFPPPPLVPDRAWAASPQLAPGMQAGATQQPTPRHHIYSPTAENAPHSASLGHLHHHHHNNYDCDLGGSSNQPAAHAAPFLDSRLTQRSPLAPSGAHPRPLTSVPANAAAPVEARALQPLSPAATATLSPPPAAVPKGAVLRAESWGSHASSDKENAPAQDILFPRHPGLHQTTASTSPQTQPLPSPHLQEPSLLLPPQLPPQQGGTLGIGGPTAAQQQASEPWSSSHQDRDSRHRDGTYLEMVPPSSRGGIGFNPTAPVGPTQLQAPALWSSYKDWGSRHREGGHLGAGGGHLGAGAGRHIEAGAGGHLRAGSTVGHLGAGAGGHFEAGAGRHLEAGAGGHLRAGSAAGHLGAGQATGAGAGGHLGGGPAAALGAGHARSCHSSPNNAAAGAEVEGLTQPPQPDRRLHALVDQLRSSRVASAAQQRTQGQGSSSSHGSSAPGGVGEQLGMGGLHTGRSLSPHTDRAASWPATGQGVVGSSGGSGNSNGGSGGGGSGGFGSIATASTGESRSPAVPGAALPPSSTTATAAGVANEAASAPKDCISSVWRRSGNHEQRPSHAFPHLSLDHSAHQGAAAQMPLPDRQPLSTLRPPSSNTPIGSIQGLPGQGVTSPASSCSSSSPSCAAGAQGPLPATAPAVSKARHTGALPACSFSFRNREGVKWADQEGAQPALGPGNGCSSAESHLATDLQLHMRTLDSEIEALGASLTAAARNAGVAAT
ncbi:hypothetical protein DUNSADRAFT_1234 [Dunaliella salina]|nr:hypothetical protein DUNSADRAFT_1234 [Dunaliella salina]|eukprot:KAF5827159.1 hypothetical protein DUNSADRAFT_1234 [Dunaliella salina]